MAGSGVADGAVDGDEITRPRQAFGMCGVLGVSDQTIARRLRGLYADHGLRIVGRVAPAAVGRSEWVVRLRCAPGKAGIVAGWLAERDDTAWVRINSGGADVVANVLARSEGDRKVLLLDELPSTRAVAVLGAHCVTHVFRGGETTWRPITSALTSAQLRELADLTTQPDPDSAEVRLRPEDESLMAALAEDGRTSYVELARLVSSDQNTLRRRITRLRDGGILYFDVDFSVASLGYPLTSLLWITVEPALIDEVGGALADLDEAAFVAATTGHTNMLVSLLSHDSAHLHRQLAGSVGKVVGSSAPDSRNDQRRCEHCDHRAPGRGNSAACAVG